jgi:hypothetical protein
MKEIAMKCTQEKLEITKEQILELKNTLHKERVDFLLEEWFPKVIEHKLKIGQWMKTPTGGFYCPKEKAELGFECYGFTPLTKLFRELFVPVSITKDDIKVDFSEVESLMIAEGVRKGYKEGVFIKGFDSGKICQLSQRKSLDIDGYLNFGYDIFRNGDWAEIIPTMPKKEAYEKFGVIIV